MSKKKDENSSGGNGLTALVGLVGLGLGALGTYIFTKMREDEKKPVQAA